MKDPNAPKELLEISLKLVPNNDQLALELVRKARSRLDSVLPEWALFEVEYPMAFHLITNNYSKAFDEFARIGLCPIYEKLASLARIHGNLEIEAMCTEKRKICQMLFTASEEHNYFTDTFSKIEMEYPISFRILREIPFEIKPDDSKLALNLAKVARFNLDFLPQNWTLFEFEYPIALLLVMYNLADAFREFASVRLCHKYSHLGKLALMNNNKEMADVCLAKEKELCQPARS